MRISDWSSDVCSSDLPRGRDRHPNGLRLGNPRLRAKPRARSGIAGAARSALHGSPEIAENRAKLLTFPFQIGETFFRLGLFEKQHQAFSQIGRASCRERVGEYV